MLQMLLLATAPMVSYAAGCGYTCGSCSSSECESAYEDAIRAGDLTPFCDRCANDVEHAASRAWRVRASSTASGWAWDVRNLRFVSVSGQALDLGICQAISSGSVSDADKGGIAGYEEENAFSGNRGWWGGRKDEKGTLFLGLDCSTAVVVKEVQIQQGDTHFARELVVEMLNESGRWVAVHTASGLGGQHSRPDHWKKETVEIKQGGRRTPLRNRCNKCCTACGCDPESAVPSPTQSTTLTSTSVSGTSSNTELFTSDTTTTTLMLETRTTSTSILSSTKQSTVTKTSLTSEVSTSDAVTSTASTSRTQAAVEVTSTTSSTSTMRATVTSTSTTSGAPTSSTVEASSSTSTTQSTVTKTSLTSEVFTSGTVTTSSASTSKTQAAVTDTSTTSSTSSVTASVTSTRTTSSVPTNDTENTAPSTSMMQSTVTNTSLTSEVSTSDAVTSTASTSRTQAAVEVTSTTSSTTATVRATVASTSTTSGVPTSGTVKASSSTSTTQSTVTKTSLTFEVFTNDTVTSNVSTSKTPAATDTSTTSSTSTTRATVSRASTTSGATTSDTVTATWTFAIHTTETGMSHSIGMGSNTTTKAAVRVTTTQELVASTTSPATASMSSGNLTHITTTSGNITGSASTTTSTSGLSGSSSQTTSSVVSGYPDALPVESDVRKRGTTATSTLSTTTSNGRESATATSYTTESSTSTASSMTVPEIIHRPAFVVAPGTMSPSGADQRTQSTTGYSRQTSAGPLSALVATDLCPCNGKPASEASVLSPAPLEHEDILRMASYVGGASLIFLPFIFCCGFGMRSCKRSEASRSAVLPWPPPAEIAWGVPTTGVPLQAVDWEWPKEPSEGKFSPQPPLQPPLSLHLPITPRVPGTPSTEAGTTRGDETGKSSWAPGDFEHSHEIQELLLSFSMNNPADLKLALECYTAYQKPLQTMHLLGPSQFEDPVVLEEFLYEFSNRHRARHQEEREVKKLQELASQLYREKTDVEKRLREAQEAQSALVSELAARSSASDMLAALHGALEKAGVPRVQDNPHLLKVFLDGFTEYSSALHHFHLDCPTSCPEDAPRDFFLAQEQRQRETEELREEISRLQSELEAGPLVAQVREERDSALEEALAMQELTSSMTTEIQSLKRLLHQKGLAMQRLQARCGELESRVAPIGIGSQGQRQPPRARSSGSIARRNS
eukprot:TRINITY_DN740_c0_g1_i2.p1 TRINITY_DN740_c0_g1~~TRINITY_DN740_c0_g1_i2.p1  ORF type:complete len:1185 (-),score=174.65 TRINITY_DN740_c0_g1_i2:159-3713(-)